MDRQRVVVAIATAALMAVVAACGGSSASPSTSASEAPTEAPAPAGSSASAAPSAAAQSPSPVVSTTAAAQCAGVALRKEPKSDGAVIVRSKAGTKVHVVEVVTGDAYQAGSCGMSGDSWLKVDRIGGKSIKVQYGVPFGYVAAGFFQ